MKRLLIESHNLSYAVLFLHPARFLVYEGLITTLAVPDVI